MLQPILIDAGYHTESSLARIDSWLRVYKDEMSFYWDLIENQKEFVPLGEFEQRVYDHLSPKAFYIVSYRKTYTEELRRMLSLILKQFGGWVACDDDWKIIYTIETLDQMTCS
jgi:hypothetical protein